MKHTIAVYKRAADCIHFFNRTSYGFGTEGHSFTASRQTLIIRNDTCETTITFATEAEVLSGIFKGRKFDQLAVRDSRISQESVDKMQEMLT